MNSRRNIYKPSLQWGHYNLSRNMAIWHGQNKTVDSVHIKTVGVHGLFIQPVRWFIGVDPSPIFVFHVFKKTKNRVYQFKKPPAISNGWLAIKRLRGENHQVESAIWIKRAYKTNINQPSRSMMIKRGMEWGALFVDKPNYDINWLSFATQHMLLFGWCVPILKSSQYSHMIHSLITGLFPNVWLVNKSYASQSSG